MNEIIKVNYETEEPTVSARSLYEGLEIKKRFSSWFDSNSQGFIEGEDFTSVLSGTVVNNGAHRELQDYLLSVDMAKHICLMSRTDKGKLCRLMLYHFSCHSDHKDLMYNQKESRRQLQWQKNNGSTTWNIKSKP